MILTYNKLNHIQKRVVDKYTERYPELEYANMISRKMIEEIHNDLKKQYGKKYGYPAWITKGPKVGRALYHWPGKQSIPNSNLLIAEKTLKELQEDEEFYNELKAHGIKI